MAIGLSYLKPEMVILSVCQPRSDLFKQGQASRDWVMWRRGVRQPSDSGFLLACVTSILFPHQKSQLALTMAWREKDLLGKQGLRQVEAASALTG